MTKIIKPEPVSRRSALAVFGKLAAVAAAASAAVLSISDAEAQTAGMTRRQERRTGRHERREERRTGRHQRREERRTGTAAPPK